MINIATVVSVASIYMKLDSPLSPFPAPRSKDRKSKVLVYKGSTPLGALAVKYIMDLGHKVVTTSSPSSSDWVSRQGTKFIIDHTKLSAEVLGELRANGPLGEGVVDATGIPPVTALLLYSQIWKAEGTTLLTVFPLLNSPPLPPNTKRVFSSYYHAFTEENKELGKWV
jgi:NADPH:quinone reductase-like Zn-dependent oxidoreductase